jgi:hypothetical protein
MPRMIRLFQPTWQEAQFRRCRLSWLWCVSWSPGLPSVRSYVRPLVLFHWFGDGFVSPVSHVFPVFLFFPFARFEN